MKLRDCQRPILLVGQGARGAADVLRGLSSSLPVSQSLLALGLVPDGLFHGFTGQPWANRAIRESDCIIAVGTRLDVRQIGTQRLKVIRVDTDPQEVMDGYGSRCEQETYFQDARAFLSELEVDAYPEWLAEIESWKTYLPHPEIIDTVSDIVGDCLVTTGVGQHQAWVARHFRWDYPARQLLTDGGHGAMGFDLPAAIGAAFEGDKVVCFVGDGSLQMNIQELATIAEYDLPVKIIVLDNRRLGLVSQFQRSKWGDDPTTGNKAPVNFVEIAEAYGIGGGYASANRLECPREIGRWLVDDRPRLIHCENIDPEMDVEMMN